MTAGAAARIGSLRATRSPTSVYGGLVAVWIVERNDGSYWDTDCRTFRSPRAQRWLAQIAPKFNAEFGDHVCLGHMSNGEGVYRRRVA